jgi:hypothetical protein
MEAVLKMRRWLDAAPVPPVGERCEFCDVPAGEGHGHVVDLEKRGLLCVCRACYLLFTARGAAGGRDQSVPDRYLHPSELLLTDAQWDEFQIPVGIAFFFRNSTLNRTVAFYPSPAGATESALTVGIWEELVAANPLLETLAPDVEALLVSRLRGREHAFIAPIDACYELVGRIRRHWRGFDGGEKAWSEIDAFFAMIRGRAR